MTMDEFDLLAELICEYPTELVTRSGCEGLAKYMIESGVTFKAAVPGHKDLYNVAEMAYENGFAKGFTQGYEEGKHKPEKRGRWIIHSSGHGRNATNWAECSECRVCGSPQWKVCPVCETRMENHSAINIEEVDFDYAAED